MVPITLVAFGIYLAWRRYVTWRHTVAADIRFWATVRQEPAAVQISPARREWTLARLWAAVTARTRHVRPGPQFRSELANPPT